MISPGNKASKDQDFGRGDVCACASHFEQNYSKSYNFFIIFYNYIDIFWNSRQINTKGNVCM